MKGLPPLTVHRWCCGFSHPATDSFGLYELRIAQLEAMLENAEQHDREMTEAVSLYKLQREYRDKDAKRS